MTNKLQNNTLSTHQSINTLQCGNITDIKCLIERENQRQENTISLIASENCCSQDVRDALGSRLTDKYAEGIPGHRYYHDCGIVDHIETAAINGACSLFGAQWANVQPHSGSQANQAVFAALLKPGDRILGMDLKHGGHLTHGSKVNISGKYYNAFYYGVNDDGLLDMQSIQNIARIIRPHLIICGASTYSMTIDWKAFREIADDVGAYLLCDIAHYAGLIAGNAYPNPLPHAHIVTSTTHKVLRGPRGGMIMSNDVELGRKIDRAVFPGIQGGPMMHAIAGKAICFAEAMKDDFKQYAHDVVQNARCMSNELSRLGWKIISGGTDSHMLNIDLGSKYSYSGKEAADVLERYGLIVNMICIPNDKRPPSQGSGIRIGTASMTSRGMGINEACMIANAIDSILIRYANNKCSIDNGIDNAIKLAIGNLARQFTLR
jgi:glycine hydroxymethyltransferase